MFHWCIPSTVPLLGLSPPVQPYSTRWSTRGYRNNIHGCTKHTQACLITKQTNSWLLLKHSLFPLRFLHHLWRKHIWCSANIQLTTTAYVISKKCSYHYSIRIRRNPMVNQLLPLFRYNFLASMATTLDHLKPAISYCPSQAKMKSIQLVWASAVTLVNCKQSYYTRSINCCFSTNHMAFFIVSLAEQ